MMGRLWLPALASRAPEPKYVARKIKRIPRTWQESDRFIK